MSTVVDCAVHNFCYLHTVASSVPVNHFYRCSVFIFMFMFCDMLKVFFLSYGACMFMVFMCKKCSNYGACMLMVFMCYAMFSVYGVI